MNSDPPESGAGEVNPYLPVDDSTMVPIPKLPRAGMGSIAAAFTFLTGVTISGAVFGLGLAIFAMVKNNGLEQAPFLVLMAMLVGACWATLFGGPVVVVGTLFCNYPLGIAGNWSPRSLRWAAIAMGATSGFASLGVLALTELRFLGLFFSCISATVGAVVSGIWIEPWVRREKAKRIASSALELEQNSESNADAVVDPFVARPADPLVE